MGQRTVVRFRKRAIWLHWLHTASFAVLLITGALMFFHLTGFGGGQKIRTVHQIAAVFLEAVSVLYALFDPKATVSFVKETFSWNHDDITWLKLSVSYYFGRREEMPPQDHINGDQKLWQLVVIITGVVLVCTGIILWFFKLRIPIVLHQWVLLTHATAFIVASVMFMVHFYLGTLHPRLEESLGSMLDGKVSDSYAVKHYRKWYDLKISGKHRA